MNGRIFIISGPSGVGKSTILKGVLANHPEFMRPINYTTRAPRLGEQEGKDYYFNRDRHEFQQLLENGELLEYVEFAGELYGTSKRQLKEALTSGQTVCTIVEVDGALSIKEAFPKETTLIFIMPPDTTALKSRLAGRRSETKEQIKERLDRVDYEIDIGVKYYDYQVVNPDKHPEQAVAEVEDIVSSPSS